MGFMFCDLHVSLNNPSSGDKFVEFALFPNISETTGAIEVKFHMETP